EGGRSLEATVEDVTPDGIEASLAPADARELEAGTSVELRFETPAFLEPLVTTATVERILPPAAAAAGGALRARALLPLHASATREVRAKLSRLAGVATGFPSSSESGRVAAVGDASET